MKRYISSAVRDISQESPGIRLRLARDIATDPKILRRLVDSDTDPDIRNDAQITLNKIAWGEKLLRRTDIDPELLASVVRVSGCDGAHYRYYVAQHPNTSDATLVHLLNDNSREVRREAERALKERGL